MTEGTTDGTTAAATTTTRYTVLTKINAKELPLDLEDIGLILERAFSIITVMCNATEGPSKLPKNAVTTMLDILNNVIIEAYTRIKALEKNAGEVKTVEIQAYSDKKSSKSTVQKQHSTTVTRFQKPEAEQYAAGIEETISDETVKMWGWIFTNTNPSDIDVRVYLYKDGRLEMRYGYAAPTCFEVEGPQNEE